LADRAQTLPAGTRLGDGGRYELRQRIGVGGMAEVYRAVDTRLGSRVVAVKTLSASVAEHPFAEKMRGLFIQEAQALSRVKDENVVDVLDFGTADDGTPYMVMEFLNGTDLGVFLRQKKHVAVDAAVDIMLGVCAGVHACHLAGIIHRDLKPANIYLSRTLKGEQPKVLDFSVAKVPLSRPAADADQAKTDLIVGTPSYMSPEQALGRPANELSDQYSIGALLYRCLTGRPPQGVLPRPREVRGDIPERLEETILRALDPTPEKRFKTVHELGHALVAFASPAGRGRWKPYYRTPPRPIDPATTGPLPTEAFNQVRAALADPVTAPSAPATVGAPAYDFKVHERTTVPNCDIVASAFAEAATSTKSTAVDVSASMLRPAPSAEPSSIDVAFSDARPASDLRQRTEAPSPSSATGMRGGRRRVILAAAAGASLVIAVTAAMIRLRDRPAAPVAAPPPTWTSKPAQPAPAPPETPSAPLAPAAVAPERPTPSATQGEDKAAPPPAPPRRTKHRRTPPAGSAIQYGDDGLPILH
jgi:serine/threonine-protein kinase